MENEKLIELDKKYFDNLNKATTFLRWCISSKVDEIVERFNMLGSVVEFKKRIIKLQFVVKSGTKIGVVVKRKYFKLGVQNISNIAKIIRCRVKCKFSVK